MVFALMSADAIIENIRKHLDDSIFGESLRARNGVLGIEHYTMTCIEPPYLV